MINKEAPSKSYFRLISSFPLSLVVFIFALQFPVTGYGAVSMEDSELRLVYKKIDSLERFTIVLAEVMGRELPSTSPISAVSNANILTLGVMVAAIEEKMGRLQYQLLRTRSNFNKVALRQAILDQKGVGSVDLLNRMLSEVLEISANIVIEHNLSAAQISNFQASNDVDFDRTIKVIYIEDSAINRRLLEEVMKSYDKVELYCSDNALDGLSLIRDINPDVLISDINMPERDGYWLLKSIRSEAQLSHIPVIALSATAMPEDIAKAKNAGFDVYLTKPFDVDELVDNIKQQVS